MSAVDTGKVVEREQPVFPESTARKRSTTLEGNKEKNIKEEENFQEESKGGETDKVPLKKNWFGKWGFKWHEKVLDVGQLFRAFKNDPETILPTLLDNQNFLKGVMVTVYALAIASLVCLLFHNTELHTYTYAMWLFFKVFGFVSASAFISLWIQIDGLIGSQGIQPVSKTVADMEEYFTMERNFFAKIRRRTLPRQPAQPEQAPPVNLTNWQKTMEWIKDRSGYNKHQNKIEKFLSFPTLFWYSTSDRFLHGVCFAGTFASVCMVLGIGPLPILTATIYACYLSLDHACDEFLALRWDALLIECAAISFISSLTSYGFQFIHTLPTQAAEPSRLGMFMVWWLAFRLMFSSGIVKLTSRDPTWVDLTAMNYHYQTQPLPSPSSHFMHNLPKFVHQLETLGTNFGEIKFNLFLFGT